MAYRSKILFSALAFSVVSVKGQALASCLQQNGMNNTIVLPSAPNYEAAVHDTFSQRLLYSPAAVVYPVTAQDVQRYVRCAATSGIAVAARSGGHSYASYDLGGANGTLVVDLSNMTLVIVHDDGTAFVQTGNLLVDLAQKLWDQGKRSIPHGFYPYVRHSWDWWAYIIRWDGRLHGLAQDRVIGAEVVLANGTLTTVSQTNHPDLFWAIRGAAPSFGIVTQWIMATLPTTPSVITYTIDYEAAPNTSQLSQIFQRWQATVVSAPDEFWFGARVTKDYSTSQNLILQLRGVYFGTQDSFDAYTANLTSLFSPGNLVSHASDWYGGMIEPLLSTGPPTPRNFFAKSLMTNAAIEPNRWDSMFSYLGSAGVNASVSWWFETVSYGGETSRQGADATAFAHRDALFSYQLYGSFGAKPAGSL
ncbi:Reticuline oxidase [Rhizoctonia solani AG-1 IB]|uniref:Reticuline oxidase n=1 Tax=Thanatephorus cucumeris (strain AG1-IB / isolate 7/3/14) TaxID=1108050 RepID=M5C921_THACB|nr:Reticuline oxidase [Rhizoctonia solani AG-1 IB]